MGFSNWETQLSFFWVPKIGHDVSHQCYIANTFGDDHRSPFWEMWPMIARAYWHWLFTWKPKRHAISRLGTQQKAPRFLGVFLGGPLIMMEFSAKFCNSKVLISELLTWRNWKPKLSLAGHEHFMAEYMFRILFAEDITPPLNRLWRCCTTIVALLGKWWSWQLWLWDDYDQPLAVRELPFFCFGTSLNPATLVKIPVLWRHNHRRRTCPSPLPTRKKRCMEGAKQS